MSELETDLFADLFESDGFDNIDWMFSQFYNVRFLKDFGAFKKGAKFKVLAVNVQGGIMQSYDENGSVGLSQKLDFCPVLKEEKG